MKQKNHRFGQGFRVIRGNRASQDAEGGADNRHRGADQWLYVLSRSGEALVAGKRHKLGAGSLLFIERREKHQIRNTGRGLLQ